MQVTFTICSDKTVSCYISLKIIKKLQATTGIGSDKTVSFILFFLPNYK